jgi:hypothetical protein
MYWREAVQGSAGRRVELCRADLADQLRGGGQLGQRRNGQRRGQGEEWGGEGPVELLHQPVEVEQVDVAERQPWVQLEDQQV